MDEATAMEAKERAEKVNDKQADIDYALAEAELSEAIAQLQTIQRMKNKRY